MSCIDIAQLLISAKPCKNLLHKIKSKITRRPFSVSRPSMFKRLVQDKFLRSPILPVKKSPLPEYCWYGMKSAVISFDFIYYLYIVSHKKVHTRGLLQLCHARTDLDDFWHKCFYKKQAIERCFIFLAHLQGTKVCRYNWHSAGFLGRPFRMLKYRYIFQIKYSEAILSNSTRKLSWFEITKMLIAVKSKFLVSFIIIFGPFSFSVVTVSHVMFSWS